MASTPVNRMFSLRGRVALVTGALGQLGRRFSEALAEAGARIVVADLDQAACAARARQLSARFRRTMWGTAMDVTRRASVRQAVEAAERRMGRIDVLVNNAGIGIFTPFEKRTEEELDSAIGINLKGVVWCTQAVAAGMRKRKSGSIINIGSIYGVVSADPRIYGSSGRNSSEVYAMTKAGVIHFTRYMAVRLAPSGVRVNCISPGGVFNRQERKFVKNYIHRTPLGRMADETDMKGAAVYLASDASAYVTGHNLVVDGGFSAW